MRNFALFALPLVLFAALFALFAANINRDPDFVPSALLNKPVPEFSLPAIPGYPTPGFATADLTGKVSVVNVFASWCIPCREEHPLLMALAKDTTIRLVGINQKDQPENAIAFLKDLGNPYEAIGADNGRVSIEWGVYGVPETFVVKDGIITAHHSGALQRPIRLD